MRTFVSVIVFLFAASLLKSQDVPFTWGPVVASAQGWNTCWISGTAQELEDRLGKFGWTPQPKSFPNIDWKNKVALVVTARDQHVRPTRIAPLDAAGNLVVSLRTDLDHPNSGVLVLAIDKLKTLKTCTADYQVPTDDGARKQGGSKTIQKDR